jgi:hypothetical protein
VFPLHLGFSDLIAEARFLSRGISTSLTPLGQALTPATHTLSHVATAGRYSSSPQDRPHSVIKSSQTFSRKDTGGQPNGTGIAKDPKFVGFPVPGCVALHLHPTETEENRLFTLQRISTLPSRPVVPSRK